MTLPEKLVAAAAHPGSWDVRGLMMDAADALLEHCSDLYDPEDGLLSKNQLADQPVERHEVVPGWTLDEILSREG
jgi:hypothetical protein